MPSRSNPNTPTSRKPKTAHALKSKRKHTQRLAANKITKPIAQTSQALRRAAPLSRKKARKLDKKIGYAKKRAMEAEGEVEMKDVDDTRRGKGSGGGGDDKGYGEETKMDIDEVE